MDEAQFCPRCAKAQTESREITPPRPWKRKSLLAAGIILAVTAVVTAVLLYHAPKHFEAGSSFVYQDGSSRYLMLLSYDDYGQKKQPMDEDKIYLGVYEHTEKPTQFFVYPADGGEADVRAEFLDKVASVEVHAEPRGGERCIIDEPGPSEDFPHAALVAQMKPDWSNGDNDIFWTFRMKNGDTIKLRHLLRIEVTKTLEYTPEDAPMATTQELQTLLDQVVENSGDYDQIILHLPAVTYDAPIVLRDRHIRLIEAEGEQRTAFTAPVTCTTVLRTRNGFIHIDFLGDGHGTGITGGAYVMLQDCTVRGWETGVLANFNADAQNTVFEKNGVGLLVDSKRFSFNESEWSSDVFLNNGLGLFFKTLILEYPIHLENCEFTGNQEDLRNETEHKITLNGAGVG